MLTLFEMSLSGGVLILAVLVLRPLALRLLPRWALCAQWLMVLALLMIPLRVPSPTSIYSAAPRLAPGVAGLLVGGELTQNVAGGAGHGAGLSPLLLLWAAVAVGLGCFFLLSHLRSRPVYRASLPLTHPLIQDFLERHRLRRPIQVRCSDQIESPLTYGVLWPVILLPKQLGQGDVESLFFILGHELAHIRRFDALTKWLLAAALCLHWFNPLAWIMYLLANRDLELACDEAVVGRNGRQVRTRYAMTLVELEEQRQGLTPLASGFSRGDLTARVKALLRAPQLTAASMGLALGAVATMAVVFATAAPSAPSPAVSATPGPQLATWSEDGTAIISKENWAVTEGAEAQWQYRREDHDRLMAALPTQDYRQTPIAQFNSALFAALSQDEKEELWQLYELVSSTISADDPDAPFLRNTVRASLNEYTARLDEVYSQKTQDPAFQGEARMRLSAALAQDPAMMVVVQYTFTYRILNQDALTVGTRDDFLQGVMSAAQRCLEETVAQDGDEQAFRAALDAAATALSTPHIQFTGIGETDVYQDYAGEI